MNTDISGVTKFHSGWKAILHLAVLQLHTELIYTEKIQYIMLALSQTYLARTMLLAVTNANTIGLHIH